MRYKPDVVSDVDACVNLGLTITETSVILDLEESVVEDVVCSLIARDTPFSDEY